MVKSTGDSLKLTNVVSPRIYRNAYTAPHGGSKKHPGADVSPDISRLLQSRGKTMAGLPEPSQGCVSTSDKSSEPTEPSVDTVGHNT